MHGGLIDRVQVAGAVERRLVAAWVVVERVAVSVSLAVRHVVGGGVKRVIVTTATLELVVFLVAKTIPTNVGPTPYWAHVAETCLKFAVGQFSGRVTMLNVHAALPTEVKRVKLRMYLRTIRGRSRWPWGQRVLCSDWSIAVSRG